MKRTITMCFEPCNHSYCLEKRFCLKVGAELYPWDQSWRERKKSKIRRQLLNHLMKLAGGWEGRGTDASVTTLLLSAPTGNLVYLAGADMPWPTLVCYLPFLLSNLPGTAGGLLREKQKEAVVLQDGWKDTTAPTRAKAFLGKKDMLLLLHIDCHCSSHGKALSTLGKGSSPSTQPLHPCRSITDCHRKDKWKWCYDPGINLWWIGQRMNFQLERDRKLSKKEGNKPNFH